MSKRMLIDASHPEETRVVVLDGNKVEEFDFESASRRPLKGNIYLAKVTRVEPSLQAAFVEYGGNRQGFLAFSEIHPDYYQIPVADRMALLADQSRRLMDEDDDIDAVATEVAPAVSALPEAEDSAAEAPDEAEADDEEEEVAVAAEGAPSDSDGSADDAEEADAEDDGEISPEAGEELEDDSGDEEAEDPEAVSASEERVAAAEPAPDEDAAGEPSSESEEAEPSKSLAEATGAPTPVERRSRRGRPPRRRQYKIQEVIRRKQIILVQVVKEERGNKGASVTTYLSLAGRYCVLMPNTPRGGGISRKITSLKDRKRLKSAAQSLELPEGMGLIIRTAGANRTKAEIKRDYEYLLRLWDSVRALTLKSNAPALVYEEGNLIKRSIRDLYSKEVSEVVVDGETGYRDAKDFMRMLMPSHAKNVKAYKDSTSLFQRHHVESQLDAMFSPVVTLKSGGYIVINQTEALVSVDVNSGKATREHSIEETAYKTNLEAADEVARQLRLRDLAGLVVIDFIDMEDGKNDRNVEKRLRDAVRNDRARIQIGKISQFGLLEMSRQRLRAGVLAGSTVQCPHCGGLGYIRSTESAALQLLRAIDDEAQQQIAESLIVYAPTEIIIYALNHKRAEISRIEQEYEMSVVFEPRDSLSGGTFEIERVGKRAVSKQIKRAAVTVDALYQEEDEPEIAETEDEEEEVPTPSTQSAKDDADEDAGGRKRRRRRRRGGRGRGQHQNDTAPAREEAEAKEAGDDAVAEERHADEGSAREPEEEAKGDRRRRRRRRGRRGRRTDHAEAAETITSEVAASEGSDLELIASVQGEPVEGAGAEIPPAFEIAPNTPSAPSWSLSDDDALVRQSEDAANLAVSEESPSGPGDSVEAEKPDSSPEAALDAPEAEPPAAEEVVPAGPPRKGWWQKRLGI
jgi:ribonuclease E